MWTILTLAFIFNVFLGAIFGRMDGGGVVKTPEWVERTLIMIYFVVACVPFAGWWSLGAYAGVVGIATGHGLYFLSRMVKATEPEAMDFIVRLFFGADPRTGAAYMQWRNYVDGNEERMAFFLEDYGLSRDMYKADMAKLKAEMEAYGMAKLYWRCVFGMFVTGTLVGLPGAIIALVHGAYIPAALLASTGLVKAAAYMIAYAIWGKTEPAEYMNGGGRTALAVLALYVGAAFFLI